MLEKIRHAGHHFTFKFIFGLIAVIFAVGLLDFSNPNTNVVLTIGKHKIALNEFLEAKQELVNQLGLSAEQVKEQQEYIDFNALTQLTVQHLLRQEADNLGIKISPEVVVDSIKNQTMFKKDNKFDLEIFKKILEANNIQETTLVEDIANQTASKYLLDALVVNMPLKEVFANYLTNSLTEKKYISLITVNSNQINIDSVADADLQEFYQQNKDSFYTKEYRSFEYLLINPDDLNINKQISESDLEKEYFENREQYAAPATRDFYHFLCPSEEIANEVATKLKTNPNYVEIAKEFAANKILSELFTNQSEQSFLVSLDPSLFQLEAEGVTAPLKSDLGWHVFKVLKIHPKQYKSFAEAKDEISASLKFKTTELAINDLFNTLEDEVASGASFEEIANKNNMKLVKVNKIAQDRSYEDATNQSKFTADNSIFALAFQLEEQEESNITLLEDEKNYAIVKVTEVIPERAQSYEEAKELVRLEYIAQLKNSLARELADIIKEKLSAENQNIIIKIANKDGLNNNVLSSLFKPIYDKYHVNLKTLPEIIFSNDLLVHPEIGKNDLPTSFVRDLFSLKERDVSSVTQIDYAKYIIAVLAKRPGYYQERIDPKIYKQIEEMSGNNYRDQIYDQYINYLKNKYKVEVNFKPLEEYYSYSN
ncbi:MAG: peptidyl-prolyl cis-trans isomerase [Rickettsiales bacterium]